MSTIKRPEKRENLKPASKQTAKKTAKGSQTPKARSKATPVTKARAKTKATAKTKAAVKAKAKTKAKAKAKAKANTRTKTRTSVKSKTAPKAKSQNLETTEANAKPAATALSKATANKKPSVSSLSIPATLVQPGNQSAEAANTKASNPRASKLLIYGIAPYEPEPGEPYMSETQLMHFRNILEHWKHELLAEATRTIHHMRDDGGSLPDPNDRATLETEFGLELKARDRERKLISKIDAALERIARGSYGYCDDTGEEIGLKRLEARPITTLSVEAQERHEKNERHYVPREKRG